MEKKEIILFSSLVIGGGEYVIGAYDSEEKAREEITEFFRRNNMELDSESTIDEDVEELLSYGEIRHDSDDGLFLLRRLELNQTFYDF